jgi:hypothetical protein
VDWKILLRLHRARGIGKEREKLIANQKERILQVVRLKQVNE